MDRLNSARQQDGSPLTLSVAVTLNEGRRTRTGMATTDWILRFTTMVLFITSVSTIAEPKQLSSEFSGSLIELSQKLAICSTASVAN